MTEPLSTHKGLDAITQQRQDRVNNLYHPLGESIKNNKAQDPKQMQPLKNHNLSNRGNTRNKFARLNEVRQRHKLEMISLRRLKADEDHNQTKTCYDMSKDTDFDVDINQLIEEERELRIDDDDNYQQELEAHFNDLVLDE